MHTTPARNTNVVQHRVQATVHTVAKHLRNTGFADGMMVEATPDSVVLLAPQRELIRDALGTLETLGLDVCYDIVRTSNDIYMGRIPRLTRTTLQAAS